MPFDRLQKRGLQMQVVERIRGQAQFRIKQEIDALLMRFFGLLDYALGIVGDIRGADFRRGGCDAYEPVRVQIEKGMRVTAGHGSRFFLLVFCRLYPVRRLANAELGERALGLCAGYAPLAFPAEHGLRLEAMTGRKLFCGQRWFLRQPPCLEFLPCSMHFLRLSRKDNSRKDQAAASNSATSGASCSSSSSPRSSRVSHCVARGSLSEARHSSWRSTKSITAGWI